jgi:hypothetical protein
MRRRMMVAVVPPSPHPEGRLARSLALVGISYWGFAQLSSRPGDYYLLLSHSSSNQSYKHTYIQTPHPIPSHPIRVRGRTRMMVMMVVMIIIQEDNTHPGPR